MAELRKIIVELRSMDQARVDGIYRRELSRALRPFAPAVRAAILNTPSAGTVPWPPQLPGLRARIARCVQTWAKIEGGVITAGVEINSDKMPDGQKSLPLMLEGVKPWRHPVFGNRELWVVQEPHPYFYDTMAAWGPASRKAIDRATQQIVDALEG